MKKNEEMKKKEAQMILRLPFELKQKLKIRCAEMNITMQEAIVIFIKEFLEKK